MQEALQSVPCKQVAAQSRHRPGSFRTALSAAHTQRCQQRSGWGRQHAACLAQRAPRHTSISAAVPTSGEGPDDMYNDISEQQDLIRDDYEGPQLVPMDESQSGLGTQPFLHLRGRRRLHTNTYL